MSDDFDKSVNVVKYNKHYMRKENTRGRNPKHDKSQDKKTCYRCGSTQHKANYPKCAALQQKCRKCGKIGHFEKVCFSKGTDVHVVQQLHNESQNYVLNVKADNTKAQPNIKCPQCMVQIQGTAVNILVDSGSPYTIIPNELYENLFADIELCDSDITPGVMGVHLYKCEGVSRQRYNTKRGKPKKEFTCRCMVQLYWVGQRKRNLRSFSTLPKSNLSYKPHRLW